MRAVQFRPTKWAGLFALVMAGYASANPPSAPDTSAIRNGAADVATEAGSTFDNLEIVDAGLNGKVAVLRVGSQQAENNLLSVFAGLKNKTARRLKLEVQTIYKDKAGNALNAGSWIAVTLRPHEEREYRSASISEQAVDFLIRVRPAPSATALARE